MLRCGLEGKRSGEHPDPDPGPINNNPVTIGKTNRRL
jgi:hypothetical protein